MRTDGDELTDIKKLIVAFCSFANAPKMNDSTCMRNVRDIPRNNTAGDTLSSRHVSSCDVTRAVGM